MDLRHKRASLLTSLAVSPALFLFFELLNILLISLTSRLSLLGVLLLSLLSLSEAVSLALYDSLFLLRMRSRLSLVVLLFLLLGGVWLNFWINGRIMEGRRVLPASVRVAVLLLIPPVFSGATGRCIL